MENNLVSFEEKKLKKRVEKILEILNDGLYEREEILQVSFLSALAGENIFLYGPPGVAKSLISRRISGAFEVKNYFEYLMQKFSTPEEVFGPVSLSELKKDNYVRKTEGYLPEAEFAFLDEIWKSNPAILNTLLTIINEKKFKNGTKLEKVPLKVMFSASNETPPPNQGLDALYDRFLVRLFVEPVKKRDNFEAILQNGVVDSFVEIPDELKISTAEWEFFKKSINKVKISEDTFNIINGIRLEIEKLNKRRKEPIYVSDRRWQKAGFLLKASAFFCDRQETLFSDCFLLEYCLWSKEDEREEIKKIVTETIQNVGIDIGINLNKFDKEKEKLEKEIKEECFYQENVYDESVEIKGKKYFYFYRENLLDKYECCNKYKNIEFYIPVDKINTRDEFQPVSKNLNNVNWAKCNFNGGETCEITINWYAYNNNNYNKFWRKDNYDDHYTFTPKLLHKKGDKKEVHPRLIKAFIEDLKNLNPKLENAITTAKAKRKEFLKKIDNPFLSKEKIKIAISSIDKQIEEIELRMKELQSLKEILNEAKVSK